MSAHFTRKDLIAVLSVVVIWGLNFVAAKLALQQVSPFQLGFLRYVFATLPFVFFIQPPKIAAKWVIAYGLVQGIRHHANASVLHCCFRFLHAK
jgi:O-acetylserine/cysteine efflux transporter